MERDREDVPEWEKSKENVQPRKQGRNIGELNAGLCAMVDNDTSSKLNLEKQKYELALRSYEGDDPLSTWYDYINWADQNYPRGGKSSPLGELLKACVKKFNQTSKYNDDERFIKIWIRFAGECNKPVDMYQYMKSRSIGTKSATFYKAWALCVEELGQNKAADKIFLDGILNGAEPVDILKKAREDFNMRTCRQVAQAISSDQPEEEPTAQRQSLVTLAASRKGIVPNDRLSASRPTQRAVLHPQTTTSSHKPQKPIQLYTDENDPAPHPVPKHLANDRALPNNKENTREAGVWTKSSSKGNQPFTPALAAASADFEVHQDECYDKTQTSCKKTAVGPGLGLSVKKKEKGTESVESVFRTHIIQTTAPDEIIQELPMYRKDLVYAGVSEFSFEELRAIKWRRRQEALREEKEMADKLAVQKDKLTEHAQQQIALLQQEVELLKQQAELSRQQMAKQAAELTRQLQTDMENAMRPLKEELLALRIENQDPHTVLAEKNQTSAAPAPPPTAELMDDKTPDWKNAALRKSVSSKRHRTPDTSSAKRSFTKMSPCDVTQECGNLMMGLYNQSLFSSNKSGSSEHTSTMIGQPSASRTASKKSATSSCQKDSGFQVFTDEQPPASVDQQKPSSFQVFSDEQQAPACVSQQKPSGLQVFSDEQEAPACVSQQKPSGFQVFSDEQQASACVSQQKPSGFQVFSDEQQTPALPSQQKSSNFQVYSDEQVLPSVIQQRPSSFQVFSDEPQAPASVRQQRPSSFQVFSDEQPPVSIGQQQSVNQGSNVFCTSTNIDKENQREPCVSRLNPGHTAGEAHSVISAFPHTDYDIAGTFAQQARLASTPFNAAPADVTGLEVSAITKHTTVSATHSTITRPSIDFTQTQGLSPITENSKESQLTSSGSTISSGAPSAFTRIRTQSSGELDSMSATNEQVTSARPTHQHYVEHHLDAVSEEIDSHVQSDVGSRESDEILQRATPLIDATFYQPPELTEAMLNTTVFIDPSNPFSESVQAKVLRKVSITSYEKVEQKDCSMPKLKVGSAIDISDLSLKLVAKLGVGGFAVAYKAVITSSRASADSSDFSRLTIGSLSTTTFSENDEVCVKVQKPACPWELYICKELRERLSCMDDDISRDIGTKLMDITHSTFYSDGSMMVNELVPHGSLLNLVNSAKSKHTRLPEPLVMYICIEMLHTVEVIHRCRIIHGDIKPDNILFYGFPEFSRNSPFCASSIKLIDFGRGIDMSKFPKGTTFTANNETEGFMCIEMKTERPWTYQTDLFGLLGTIYPLLCLNYMTVVYRNGRWQPSSLTLPRSYKSKLWAAMFAEFLNIESCDHIPSVSEWRERFEAEFMVDDYEKVYEWGNSLCNT